jgi:hypothetical protein
MNKVSLPESDEQVSNRFAARILLGTDSFVTLTIR